MKLKNIPNILSIIRIILVFVFVYVLFVLDAPVWALVVFLTAGATDVVDGFLARRYDWVTNLGKILDPVADKLMQCTVLVCLCIKEIIPIWFAAIFFLKEGTTLLASWIVIRRRSVVVVSKWYGKAAVCLFYLTIVIAVLFADFFAQNTLWKILIFVPTALFALGAFFGYVKHYYSLKGEEVDKSKIRDVIK